MLWLFKFLLFKLLQICSLAYFICLRVSVSEIVNPFSHGPFFMSCDDVFPLAIFFSIVAIVAFCFTCVSLLLHLFNPMNRKMWIQIELFVSVAASLFFLSTTQFIVEKNSCTRYQTAAVSFWIDFMLTFQPYIQWEFLFALVDLWIYCNFYLWLWSTFKDDTFEFDDNYYYSNNCYNQLEQQRYQHCRKIRENILRIYINGEIVYKCQVFIREIL